MESREATIVPVPQTSRVRVFTDAVRRIPPLARLKERGTGQIQRLSVSRVLVRFLKG
jgi:hypothetical protein